MDKTTKIVLEQVKVIVANVDNAQAQLNLAKTQLKALAPLIERLVAQQEQTQQKQVISSSIRPVKKVFQPHIKLPTLVYFGELSPLQGTPVLPKILLKTKTQESESVEKAQKSRSTERSQPHQQEEKKVYVPHDPLPKLLGRIVSRNVKEQTHLPIIKINTYRHSLVNMGMDNQNIRDAA